MTGSLHWEHLVRLTAVRLLCVLRLSLRVRDTRFFGTGITCFLLLKMSVRQVLPTPREFFRQNTMTYEVAGE